jgi:hypothetical protein
MRVGKAAGLEVRLNGKLLGPPGHGQASLHPFFHSTLEMEVQEPAFRNASDYTRLQFLKNVIEVLPGSHGRSYLRQQLRTPLWVLMAIT